MWAANLYPTRLESFVPFADPLLIPHSDPSQNLERLLRREVLTTGLARLGSIHLHEVLVGITKRVNGVVLETSQRQIAHRIKNLNQFSGFAARPSPLQKRGLLTSKSAKRPLRSRALSLPATDPSMLRNTPSKLSLRFSSCAARTRTLTKKSDGKMKNPSRPPSPQRCPWLRHCPSYSNQSRHRRPSTHPNRCG